MANAKMTNLEWAKSLYSVLKAESPEFVDRIPEPTRDNMAAFGNGLAKLPAALFDQFSNILIYRIGRMYVNRLFAYNPLRFLRKEDLEWGGSIQDIFVDILKAYQFDTEGTDPGKKVTPPLDVCYYTVDFDIQYAVSVSRKQLLTAFTSEGQFQSLFDGIVGTLYESAEHDAYIAAKALMANYNGYTNRTIPAIKTDDNGQTAKNALSAIRKGVLDLRFDSRNYNPMGVMQNTPTDRMIIFMYKDFYVDINVEYLAGVFNLSRVELESRIVVLDDFGDVPAGGTENTMCIICDERIFQIHYQYVNTSTFYNPKGEFTTYYYTIQAIYAMGRFFNTLRFTTAPLATITFDVNGGTGSMPSITVDSGSSFLAPTPNFTAPAGKVFAGWTDEASGTTVKYKVGDTVTLGAGVTALTLTALWGSVVVG